MRTLKSRAFGVSAAVTLFLATLVPARAADEWPQFRGPDGQGHAPAGRVPLKWSETENLLWKAPLPGRGWSSPVISGGVCWLTTAVVHHPPSEKAEPSDTQAAEKDSAKEAEVIDSVSLQAIAVELETGKLLHDIELFQHKNPEAIHTLNSYASPTPVLHAGRLYCHFGNMGTACVDTVTGEIAWTTRLPSHHSVGPGSSPALYENLLIVPSDGTDAQFVEALDIASGERVWKTPRPPVKGEEREAHKSFSTPLVIRVGETDQVVIPGPQWIVSYNPLTGEPLWQVHHGDGFSIGVRPIAAPGLVIFSTGYMTPELVAIRTDGTGDVTDTHVAWRIGKQVPTMSSPILVGDAVFMVTEQGVVTCADVQTGKVRFQKRIPGSYSSSPLVADGKLLFSSREGDVTVVPAGPDWKELAKNHVDGQLMASPAVWRDSLILRTGSALYRIGETSDGR